MVNTINAVLYPKMFSAVYEVARKQAGFIGAVNFNFAGDPVAIAKAGEDKTVIEVPVAGVGTIEDYTAAQVATVGANLIHTKVSVQVTESKDVPWHTTDDETEALSAEGQNNAQTLFLQNIASAMGIIMDAIEVDIADDIYKECSRARSVAGTTPFATDLGALTAVKRVFRDNGVPEQMRSYVMNSAAEENASNLNILQAADASGSPDFLRNGVFGRHLGFDLRVSGGIDGEITKGTATGFDSDGGSAIGDTTLAMNGSDAGTVLAGDIVTFAGDTNKYVVANVAQTLSGNATGNIVINEPGLKETLAADTEGTIGASFTPNIGIYKNGYVLAVRPPAIKANGYIKAVTPIADPESGLTFFLVEIPGDGLTTWRLHAAWGKKGLNSNFVVNSLG